MKKPYTKKYILAEINDFCESSQILGGKNSRSIFTINELLYCIESLRNNNGPSFNIQINSIDGAFIPCFANEPYFVDIQTRSKKVRIRDVEIYDEMEDEDNPDWTYLLIIEEVKGE